ncbi:Peptidoglycan-binding Lysin subgroup domain protein [Candidatus Magnetomorum sp. HK-1]|nr:Peptidoglycan-binding Lysin subgroup domain protein [Candidatus Magnetomorum sp. HK-1]
MISYNVIPSDTLSAIAQRNSTTVDQIMMINPEIKYKNLISAGQTINIPSESVRLQALKTKETTRQSPQDEMESPSLPCEKKENNTSEEEDDLEKYLHVIVLVSGTKNPVNDLFSFFLENPQAENNHLSNFSYWQNSFIESVLELKKCINDKYEGDVNFNIDLYKDFSWSGDNSYNERVNAGMKLAQNLKTKYKSWQNNNVYFHLIGHSHGGNVINEFSNHTLLSEKWFIKTIVYLSTPFFQRIHQPKSAVLHDNFNIYNIKNYYDLTQIFVADFTIVPSFQNFIDLFAPALKNAEKTFNALFSSVTNFVKSLRIVKDRLIDYIKSYRPFGTKPREAKKKLDTALSDLRIKAQQVKKDILEFASSVRNLLHIINNSLFRANTMPDKIKKDIKSVADHINEVLNELEPKAIMLVDSITNFNFGKIITLFINLIDRLFQIVASFVDQDWILKVVALFSLNIFDYFDNTRQKSNHYRGFSSCSPTVEEVSIYDSYRTSPNSFFFQTFKSRIEQNENSLDEQLESDFDSFKYSKWNNYDSSVILLISIYRILAAQLISNQLEFFKTKIESYYVYVKIVKSINDTVNKIVESINKGVNKLGRFLGYEDWGHFSVGNKKITAYFNRVEQSRITIISFVNNILMQNIQLVHYTQESGLKNAFNTEVPGTLAYLSVTSHSVSRKNFSEKTIKKMIENV